MLQRDRKRASSVAFGQQQIAAILDDGLRRFGKSLHDRGLTAGQRRGHISDTGICLGDECTVEAGLYLTAGTRVAVPDGQVVKALTLSGQPGLLFRRNSQTGAVEALPRSGKWTGLNAALHSNT